MGNAPEFRERFFKSVDFLAENVPTACSYSADGLQHRLFHELPLPFEIVLKYHRLMLTLGMYPVTGLAAIHNADDVRLDRVSPWQ
jgi:hypothetical protein